MPSSGTGSVRAGAAALLLLTAAVPAHPLFAPNHDVSITYRLETPAPSAASGSSAAGGKTTEELRLRAIAGGTLLRLDTPATGAYLLINRAQKTATVVDRKIRAFLTGPLNPNVARGLLLLDPAAAYQAAGTATVAGLACEVWKIGPGGTDGSACITAGGVVLSRIAGSDPGRQARLTALSVTYGTQPKALFSPPPGFHDLSALQPPRPLPAPPPASKSH